MAPLQKGTADRIGKGPDAKSKVDRYGWAKPGAAGEMRWVPKGDIFVDDQYQRAANEPKIQGIASAFSWPAFGVALVARRGDGKLYAMDAQHRILAARRRSDVGDLPCIIFDMTSVKDEAATFLASNTYRKPLTSIDKHKARSVCGDASAVLVSRLLADYGRVPATGTQSNGVRCLRTLTTLAEKDDALLIKLWPLMMDLTKGIPLEEKIVLSLSYIEKNAADGASLLDPRWRARCLKLGALGIVTAATRAAAGFARGGARVFAIGVVDALNKGCQHRLVIAGGITDQGE